MSVAAVPTSGKRPLPNGWRLVPIGDVCARRIENRDPKKQPEQTFTYIDITSIDRNLKTISVPQQLRGVDAPSRARQIVRGGDVLVSGTRPNLNAVALVSNEFDGEICSTGFCVLRPSSSAIIPEFLFAYVQTDEFIKSLSDSVKGALYPAVTDSQIKGQHIPLPPRSVQERIVELLEMQTRHIRRARTAAEAQLQDFAALTAVVFRCAFRRITPLRVSEISDPAPCGWRWIKLIKIARLESGHTPSRYHKEWWDGDVPWLALPDIRTLDGKVAFKTSEYTNDAGLANSSARLLPAGTVCLSRTASVGFVTMLGCPMATSQDFVNWVCGPELAPEFLALLLRASRNHIRSLSSGAVHKTVYMPAVKLFEVCIPPLEDQKVISERLNRQLNVIEVARDTVEAEITGIETLTPALLRRAFSGEL